MTQSAQMMEELDDCFAKTATYIMKYYVDEEERIEMLKMLRNAIKENCAESARMMAANKIKEELDNLLELDPNRNIEDITKDYKKAVSEIKVDPLKDKRLLEYDHQIEELLQADKVTSSNTLDDTDADLQLTGTDINIIDPISKMRMTNPVRNVICGHVYDKESLVAMLQKNKKTRCPVVGCTSTDYISLSRCRTDIVTKMYLEKNPV